MFRPVPIFRHHAVTSAAHPKHFIFFTTNVFDIGRLISCSFSDIEDPGHVGTILERELPLNLVMSGVR